MQKTFIKYTFFIITSAIFLILFVHFRFSLYMLEEQQYNTFHAKTEQMIHTLENNQEELRELNESLDEDYLTRAKAAAYVMDMQEDVPMNVWQMQYLARLLNVDELHVIDENGFIISSSVSKYAGFDMNSHKQTREFLSLLKTNDKNAYLIQDAQPNAAEDKLMKYVGVVRKSQKGIVQVGFKPTRQMEAISRNTYHYIFSRFPTDIGEELFVADASTGEILGHSGGMEREFLADCYQLEYLNACRKGAYIKGENGENVYAVSKLYEDVLLCALLPQHTLFQRLWKHLLATLAYLFFIEAAVILLFNYLIKKKVISGIHQIIENLTSITNGNLDTVVAVSGNHEFEALSTGINTMVKSIVNLSNRISAIIEISGIPLAAFEYGRGSNHVFTTSGLSGLLDIPAAKAARLYKDSTLFGEYIREITLHPLEGEEDIFKINEKKYIRIHMSESEETCLGIITDVSKDMLQKQQMQYENTHDALTGLYQYGHFKQLAEEILHNLSAGKVCAVVMLDLDYFKPINDTFGHDAGDRYLQEFSSVMHSMPVDHFLCARRSGDEFCMMIYGCDDKAEILRYLDLFYETLNGKEIMLSSTHSQKINASAGFVWTSSTDDSISEFLSRADDALYKVKKDNKGYYTEYIN